VRISGGDIRIDGTWDVTAGKNIFMTSFDVLEYDDEKEDYIVTAVVTGWANLGHLKLTSASDISITDDWLLTVLGTFNATAEKDITIANSNITASANTNWTATNGDLTVTGGTIDIGGDWNVTADNSIFMTAVDLSAQSAYLNAKKGSILIDGTAPVSEWAFYSLLPNKKLNIAGILNMLAANDIGITNADITAGDTTLTAENGDVTIEGGSISINGIWNIIANNGDIALKSVNVLKAGATTLDAAGKLNVAGGTLDLASLMATVENDRDAFAIPKHFWKSSGSCVVARIAFLRGLQYRLNWERDHKYSYDGAFTEIKGRPAIVFNMTKGTMLLTCHLKLTFMVEFRRS